MNRLIAAVALGALSHLAAAPAATPSRWQFAGENQGIRFYFKIANECRNSGAKVELKLESTLDYAATVSFRLVDPKPGAGAPNVIKNDYVHQEGFNNPFEHA